MKWWGAEVPAVVKESGFSVTLVHIYRTFENMGHWGKLAGHVKLAHDLEPSPAFMAPNKSDFVLTQREFVLCGLIVERVRSMVMISSM